MTVDQPPTREELLAHLAAGGSLKADLLGRIAVVYEALSALLIGATEAQLTAVPADGWSVRSHLHHLTAWERKVVAQMNETSIPEALGVSQALWDADEIDGLNTAIQAHAANLSGVAALDAFHAGHANTLLAIAALAETDLLRPGYLNEPDGAPLLAYIVGNTYEHYADHLAAIQALLADA